MHNWDEDLVAAYTAVCNVRAGCGWMQAKSFQICISLLAAYANLPVIDARRATVSVSAEIAPFSCTMLTVSANLSMTADGPCATQMEHSANQ
jgi:hypothetical protein